MLIRKIPISKINPATYNPRKNLKPDDSEYQKLLGSIDEFGYIDPLIWNKKTGNLVGGHQRLKILLAKGLKEIEVSVVDLPIEKEKLLNIALNKISGEWDREKLAHLLDGIPELDLKLTGFDLPEAENLIAGILGPDTEEDNFDLDALLAKDLPVITKPGDLITLGLNGEHRLLCGDATKSSDVAKVMGDFRARLCHMDPPYNVNYNPDSRPVNKKTKNNNYQGKITNDNLTPQKYSCWLKKVIDSVNEALVPGACFYIWNSHKNFGLMHDLLTEQNFKIASVITWAKESFAPGFGDYNEQTEFCLYGWKCGAKHNWFGPKNESTLWRINRDRTLFYNHPTQKALELAERAIRNSSKSGDIVFDPFLGSGTTLVAAARLGRRCFGMEIEPKYCDVIVRRYIATAGKDSVSKKVLRQYYPEEVMV
jgi:DNA modification methylase